MVSKLTQEDQQRLRHLSANGVPIKQLMREFNISIATVERYKFDHLRDLSRRVQSKRNKTEKVCYKCGMFKTTHAKCARCEIFVHNGKDYCDDHLPSLH